MVLASRFIACARKSSVRPMGPPAVSAWRTASMWLFKRTVSSSVQILSANTATSVAMRLSSTWLPASISFILPVRRAS